MTLPGFTAEVSLCQTGTHYGSAAIKYGGIAGYRVEPQKLPAELSCYFRCGELTGWWNICAYACHRDPHVLD